MILSGAKIVQSVYKTSNDMQKKDSADKEPVACS